MRIRTLSVLTIRVVGAAVMEIIILVVVKILIILRRGVYNRCREVGMASICYLSTDQKIRITKHLKLILILIILRLRL